MSRKDDLLYLGQMSDTVRKIQGKLTGVARGQFDSDENLRLALLRLVQTVGEAARRVSESGRAAHPEVPWQQVVGMRHNILHDHMDFNEDIVWATVTEDMSLLPVALARFAPPNPPGASSHDS